MVSDDLTQVAWPWISCLEVLTIKAARGILHVNKETFLKLAHKIKVNNKEKDRLTDLQ